MLSVAMCTYNGALYIEEQLQSILNQSMPVDEIVICDDGSTDDTLNIIDRIRSNSTIEFHIYRNDPHLGVYSNFFKAINLCKGDVIFLSDQDDIWRFDKVETITNYLIEHQHTQVIFTNGQLIDTSGNIIESGTLGGCFGMTPRFKKLLNTGYGVELFAYGNRATGATMAVRKEFVHLPSFINYCSVNILHDGALAMLALNDNKLGYIDDCITYYRVHDNQKCGIGDTLNNPNPDTPLYVSYVASFWNMLDLPLPLKDRISFLVYRNRQQHKTFGVFKMIYKARSYYKFYHHKWLIFLFFDMWQWCVTVWGFLFLHKR